jgi:hypothetical protein
MRKFTFQVVFTEDQDIESFDSEIEQFYVLLEQMREQGILFDYNCSDSE